MQEITRLSAEEIREFCEKNMPPGFVESKKKTDKRKICIALLAYDAKSFNRTWMCILSAIFQCAAQGWEVSIALRESDSMVARGRSFLASQFLNNPDAGTDFVQIDTDLEWTGDEFMRLCSHPVDVIGGAYPYKDEGGNFPLRWPPDGLMEENGLWEVQAVTPGFMRITRKALEKIARERPWIKFADPGMPAGKPAYMFFNNETRQTGVYDEGYIFCEHWRGVGGKVYLDPDFNLTHIGLKAYNHGTLRQWLAKKAETFEKLESEFPGVPPLKLMDKVMGKPVDLEAEKAKHEADNQHSSAGPAGTAGDDGRKDAAEHQAGGYDPYDIGGSGRRNGSGEPESAAAGPTLVGIRQGTRRYEGGEIRSRLNGGAG